MFVAELSALDLGKYVDVIVVPKGSRYPKKVWGYITEIKHNIYPGHTQIRLWQHVGSRPTAEDLQRRIQHRDGSAYTILYGDVVEPVEK